MTASVVELAARREGGTLVLDGEMECAVTYVGTDAAVRRRDGRVAFRRVVETGESVDSDAIVGAEVRAVEFQLRRFPGRDYGETLDYRARLQILPADTTQTAGPAPPASFPARYSPLQVEELVAEQGADALEEREVALDLAAFKVIDLQTTVAEAAGEVLAGTVVVEGTLFQKIYYVAEDGLIHYQHAEFPFHRMVEVPAAGPGLQVQVTVRVRAVEFDLSGDGRRLAEKLQLAVQVKLSRLVELEAMTDLAAPPGVEVRRELVRVDRVVGRGRGRCRESVVIRMPAPGGRLVKAAAVIEDLQSQVLHGQVLVEGTVREQVFFTTGGTAYHQEEEVPFTCVVDVPGAEPGMLARAQARVEEVAPDPGVEGPEVGQEVVVGVSVRVAEGRALEVVTAVDGLPGREVERRRLTVERLVGQGAAQVMLQKKAVLVSRALGIVRVVGSIQDLACEVIPDQVIVQGRLHQQVLFIDRHKVERHQTEDIPFTQLVEVPGALPGMAADVEARVKHMSHSLLPEGSGFAEKAVIDLAVWVVERAELSVVTGVGDWTTGAPALRPGEFVTLSGEVPLPRPFGRVGEVWATIRPPDTLRVHVFFAGPNRLVYHTCRDFPVAGGTALGVRELRWTPVAGSRGLCEGVRWEAVLACSGLRST